MGFFVKRGMETETPYCALEHIITWGNLVRCLLKRKSHAFLCFKNVLSLAESALAQKLCSVEEREFLTKRTHNQTLLLKEDSSLPKPPNQTVLQDSVGSRKGRGCWWCHFSKTSGLRVVWFYLKLLGEYYDMPPSVVKGAQEIQFESNHNWALSLLGHF